MSSRINSILLLVLLIPLSSATSLSLPKEIPANANWGFSAALDPTGSFDFANVYLDEQKILSAHSNGRVVVDPLNGALVLHAFLFDTVPEDNSGMVLYVSHFGLNAGKYKIRAETLNDNVIIGNVSGTLEVFDAVSKAYAEGLNSNLNALQQESKSLEKTLQESSAALEQKIAQGRENISRLQALYAALKSGIDSASKSLKESAKTIGKLEAEISKLKSTIKEQDARLESLGAPSSATAYATMGGFSAIALVVAMAMVALALWMKRQGIAELLKGKKAP